MKKTLLSIFCCGILFSSWAQNIPYSVQMAESLMQTHADSIQVKIGKPATWDYEQGLYLKALENLHWRTGDARYFQYILKNMQSFVNEKGEIRTYKFHEFNSDNITTGRLLLSLYQELGDEKYKLAADLLRSQIKQQPRTKEGGFWHKDRYPDQMWLDGLYMLEPFYAEYSQVFHENNWNDIALQFELMYKNALDPATGLLFHAYDHERKQGWANKQNGHSPNFWGRSLGWYVMALVDVLDYFPQNHPKRAVLITQLNQLSRALLKVRDSSSGLWYQLPTLGSQKGNYLEASCANMFVYAFMKGVRKGYLPSSFSSLAQQSYQAILDKFISKDTQGYIHLEKTVSVGGLGGSPYRDGSFAYYMSEPLKTDDLKGTGPFIMASIEMEIAKELGIGKGKKVVLDYYFNHEYRKNKQGKMERFHYTWEDRKDSGFQLLGTQIEQLGARIDSLDQAPTLKNLANANVYIIVDPDSPKETSKPNYMRAQDADEIEKWVKAGGTLILLANDTTNCEIPKFNTLAKRFGMEFMGPNLNMVQGKNWHQGTLQISANNPIFKGLKKIYIKEISTIKLSGTAQCLESLEGHCVMSMTKVGKGKVFALGDPWIYNEYTNNRRIPLEYENFPAAKKLIEWALKP
ncbi:glycoside hydrolase family 88/105 protein [Aquirufa rosea]|uniref:Glycoside hydrolase family 88 protein n=1 Tax=Aquirufa rosea TaxID=2509241 RepID=A0A4Q1BXS9_9BACT|nr:glycoside hydrolase family 88 protein [Aquirufa rosea]RXK47518.1 glycoside hydrolase family 88 protein [Aquirufa rosea]